jgi:hypothetical protein
MQRKKQHTKNKALVIAVSEYQHADLKGKDGKGLDFCKNDGIEMSRDFTTVSSCSFRG